MLYDPSGFERELLRQLEKLRGLWDKLPSEIAELIMTLIGDVEQAFENGYVYIEQYGREGEYFESEEVNAYIVQFVRNLPKATQRDYAERLQEKIMNPDMPPLRALEKGISNSFRQKTLTASEEPVGHFKSAEA